MDAAPQTRSHAERKLEWAKEPHFPDATPADFDLFTDTSGRLRLTMKGERSYLDVRVARAFPFSYPGEYFALQDGAGKVICMVRRLKDLPEEARKLAEAALDRQYFIPVIGQVKSLREEYGVVYVDVETDRGPKQLVATGLRDAIVDLGDGELLLADVDGNRFRIPDWRRLDGRSRKFLERVV